MMESHPNSSPTAPSWSHPLHGGVSSPRHHRHVIPYQLDHTKHSTGKHVSTTKRRISFSFGFASLPALAKRAMGPAARGVEYEVVLFWSLFSGKRHVYLNNRLIHSSVSPNRSVQKFVYTFNLGNNEHDVRIIAHVASPSKGVRQYDLKLDGQSYFDMLRIYELGGSKCREMYGKDMEYAERLSPDELDRWEREEKEASPLGATRTAFPGFSSWRNGNGAPDHPSNGMANGRIHDRRGTAPPNLGYGPPGKAHGSKDSSARSPPHPLAPSTCMEEEAMLEAAKQRSLRDLKAGGGGTAPGGSSGNGGWGRQPPQLRQQQQRHQSMPAFTGFHEAFRPSSQRVTLDPINEQGNNDKGADLIDLSSEAPSNGNRPAVGRAASTSVLTGTSVGAGGGGGGPDLIDLSSTATASAPPLSRPSFGRDVSEVTLDPSLLRQSSVPGSVGFGATTSVDVDELSMASATPEYGHLDPSRAFQGQGPPVYDASMRDILTPQGPPTSVAAQQRPRRSSGFAAQPTWDEIDATFAQQPPPTCQASHAPTDTSFAQYAAPVMPGSGASFAYAPPPTMDQMNQDFGYVPTVPASQQPQRPQHPWNVGQTSGGGAVSAGYR